MKALSLFPSSSPSACLSAIALVLIAAFPAGAQEQPITDPPPYIPATGTQQDLGSIQLANPDSLLGGVGGEDEGGEDVLNPYSLDRGTTFTPTGRRSPAPLPSDNHSSEGVKLPLTQF